MDIMTIVAAVFGLISAVVATLVGLTNLVAFVQKQREKKPLQPVPESPLPFPALAPTTLPSPVVPPKAARANLPTEATPLIGREQDVTAVRALLQRAEVRLVTLVGPPGAGKTRLGLKVAATFNDDFADGVFFIALAALQEATLVAPTIAQTLGLREVAGQPLPETLKYNLQDQQMLLVLDNFEQVMPAASLVTELLAAAPRLEVLVTSREALHVSGEHEFAVPPLALPDRHARSSVESVAQAPAVRLFLQRAQAVKPDFRLTAENAPAVAELCTLLDGLPLAIELAAARSQLFSPQEMLTRLESRFHWLTSGVRDLPVHQQTLQSTLDWSYNLLAADEQTLLRRLGVFVGGCSLAAIEAVCQGAGDLPMDVVEGVASLMDKSLLQRQEGIEAEPRFTMLETVRVYARAKLFESGESESLRSHHLTFYLNLVERAEPKLWGEDPRLLDQLEQEHDNLRAALQWAREQKDVETLARLVASMFAFWFMRGYWREGGPWLEAVLAQRTHLSPSMQANMLTIYGEVVVRLQGEYARAKQIFEEALTLWRALDDPSGMAWALNRLGETVMYQEDYAQAETYWAESLRLYRESGVNSAWALYGLGNVVRLQGDHRRAQALLEEALMVAREGGERRDVAWSLTRLGQIRLAQGNYPQATALLRESLAGYRELRQSFGLAESLVALGSVALAQQQPARAVQLFGAADKLLGTTDWRMAPKDKTEYERNVATARAQLGDERFSAAWAEGQAMTQAQAIAYALSDPEASSRETN